MAQEFRNALVGIGAVGIGNANNIVMGVTNTCFEGGPIAFVLSVV
jgi:hypothetical protein